MTSTDRPDDREITLALLREELDRMRERAASHPHDIAVLERRLADARAEARTTAANNERLAATLREAREQIVSLKSEVDRLAQPPASFGVFVAEGPDATADIYTSGRKMRVSVSPDVDLNGLEPGRELIINEALNVVGVQEFTDIGEVVLLKEVMEDGHRALVIGHGDEEQVVRLAARLKQQPIRSGDSLLVDRRVGFAFERVPKLDVEELVLEEVPDIDYSVIGGLSSQIEAIRDAVELPFLYRDLFAEHELKAPKGILLYGPPGCGKTLIEIAVD
jgi:proteasome-associated ATPase